MAVNFTDMTDEDFYSALYDANKKLLENYYTKQLQRSLQTAKKLYFERDKDFRGFRQS